MTRPPTWRLTTYAVPLLGLLLAAPSADAQAGPLSPAMKKAAITTMKQALRQALVTQSKLYEAHQSFSKTPLEAPGKRSPDFRLTVVEADGRGWAAVTTSAADSALHCGLFVGMAVAPNAAVLAPTVPACWSVDAKGVLTSEN